MLSRSTAAATLLVIFCSPIPAAADNLPSETVAQLDKVIAAEMSRQKLPGLAVAVVLDRRVSWAHGFGLADVENAVPVQPQTVFRLASLSKPITAVAIMQLVERGKIDLDLPIQKYVPGFPKKPWPITSRQLLAHLSGIRHYRNEAEQLSTRRYDSLAAALTIFQDDPLLFQPGARYLYTTYGYNVLGCVLEGAAKTKFTDYLREHVFVPARMEQAGADDARQIIRHRARGYVKTANGELANAPAIDPSNKIPGGGLCASCIDLARFAVAIESGTLLKAPTLAMMCQVQKTTDGKPAGAKNDQGQFMPQGLGWAVVHDASGRQLLRAGGKQHGVRLLLYMAPAEGFALVLMANIGDAELDRPARQITELLLNGQRSVP